MKQFTLYILFCFILSACSPTESPSLEKPAPAASISDMDSMPFPQSWLGNWEGTLLIYKDNKVVQEVPMELEMLHMDTSANYTWAIIYGADKEAGRRPYELAVIDASKGQYLLDEKNSIKIESYLFDNKLMSWYEVMGNQILSIQEKRGKQMIFEIIFGSAEPVSTSGNQQFQGEDIPAVNTFPIKGYQKAVLTKKE